MQRRQTSNTAKTSNSQSTKRRRSKEQPLPQPPPDQAENNAALPADPVAQRKAIKDVFLNSVGANVLTQQTSPFVCFAGDDSDRIARKGTETFIEALKDSIQPRDAIEEMLVLQMAWTHARLAKLSSLAGDQTQTSNVQVVNDACDRAANTFRRQMLALAEYRRPPRTDAFLAIRQANVANQQVVQNGETRNSSPIASNEQGSAAPPALSAHAAGAGVSAPGGPPAPAVAVEHRPPDGRRQEPLEAERLEARPSQR